MSSSGKHGGIIALSIAEIAQILGGELRTNQTTGGGNGDSRNFPTANSAGSDFLLSDSLLSDSLPASSAFDPAVSPRFENETIDIHRKNIIAVVPLDQGQPGTVTFFSPKTKRGAGKLRTQLSSSRSSLLLTRELAPDFCGAQLLIKDPYKGAVMLLEHLAPPIRQAVGIDQMAAVDSSAKLGENCSIGPFAVVGAHAVIGDRVTIYPHAVVYPGAMVGSDSILHAGVVVREGGVVGSNCILQPGVVIGGDGFGYIPDPQHGHRRIPHIGRAILGDGVDLGANSTVDRGMLGDTKVGSGTKIDNLVMLGHNVQVGEHSFLCAQVGVSGSTTIGRGVTLAGQVGVADHVTIGDGVRVGARGGVIGDIEAGATVLGFPHQEARQWRREQAALRKLPDLLRKISPRESGDQDGEPKDLNRSKIEPTKE